MRRRAFLSVGLILLAIAVVGWLWWWMYGHWEPNTPLPPLREVRPEATVVLPTLDTPIPEGKSALWCASFQLAWEQIKRNVTKGPVRLTGAEEIARRLNDAPSVADTVNERDTYAAAGFVRDGIVPEIKREMARRFPEVTVTELEEFPGGAVAYAYLQAAVKFTRSLLENDRPLEFVGSDGSKKAVRSFGLPYRVPRRHSPEEQVEILHASEGERFRIETFVIDLCKDSSPYQVLIARIPRQPTLAATLADMEKRIAGKSDEGLTRPLGTLDSLVIPHLRFRITHRFKELEGKKMPDQGLILERAVQRIDFRLDATGARLASESRAEMKKGGDAPRRYSADRPFLVLMRKRGMTQPFFVLWVENGELLESWG